MTNDEAIKVLKMVEAHGLANEAKNIAIKALETGMVVMKGEDYDLYMKGYKEGMKDYKSIVEENERLKKDVRPKGKWRSVGFEKGYAFCICSECGKTTRLYRDSKNEFCCIADIRNKVIACMYCGADMRGEA